MFRDNKDKSKRHESSAFVRGYEKEFKTDAPDVGIYDPIRYNDIGIKDQLSQEKSNMKRQLQRKLSVGKLGPISQDKSDS